ncbi:MAG: RNA methyltransferase [Clostridia bacterium]|nr:RNA methyltransferase [Clostridia bacterium]
MVKKLLSSQNSYLKKVAKLKTRKYREEFGLFLVEGLRACREVVSSDFLVESVIMTEEFFDTHGQDFQSLSCIVTTDAILAWLCDTKTPQGVLAVVHLPKACTMEKNRYIYCDCIQDPGNAGTIIRSADAFGFDGVIFSCGSVDVFSPKVIRATMGSVFHIDVMTEANVALLTKAKQAGFFVTASALHGASVDVQSMTRKNKQIFVVGNEGNGVSDAVLSLSDEIVHIPMQGAAESLNAGVAASILMYEVLRHE